MYKRIRDLISNTSKKFHVFANEHHRETFIERKEGESANDRNDRAIRIAVNWYNKHLQQVIKGHEAPPTVILITNDRENRQKAADMGILAYTIHDYAKSLTEHPSLVDRLARITKDGDNSEVKNQKGKILFPEHLPLSTIQTGVKTGKYFQGPFQGSRENYLEGFVNVASMEKFVLIQGLQHLNRAVHEDIVAIELFPESEWTCLSGLIMKDAEEQKWRKR